MPDLIQIVDAALADAARRSGAHLLCRPGCTQCCVGVFAISQQDAGRLREGLVQLSQTDAARADRIYARVAASIARLEESFPGDCTTGILAEDSEAEDAFEGFGNEEVCPVLDPVTGTCDLYSARPVLCRTFGPPMRDADGNLAACELCYTTATVEEIEACELDPAIRAIEENSNETFNVEHGVCGETIVALALRCTSTIQRS
jgi:Fe-S-cluster containining protein